jgi:hypothetical protein
MTMDEIKVGDTVRVKDTGKFIAAFERKVMERDGIVEWVGPDQHGQFKGMAWVRFLKRNGRGKEFRERMCLRELVKQ